MFIIGFVSVLYLIKQACNLDSEEMRNSENRHAYQFTLYILDGAATLLILESCSGDVLVLRKSFAAKRAHSNISRAKVKINVRFQMCNCLGWAIWSNPNKTSCVVFEPSRLLVNTTRVLGDF